MVGLRKACSLLLVAWVVLSPMVLSWHRALAHPHGSVACGTSSEECCGTSTSVDRLADCPFNRDSTRSGNFSAAPILPDCGEDCSNSSCPSDRSDSDHSCPVCEMLLHDDILIVQWYVVPFSTQKVQAVAEPEPISLSLDVPNYWSVRGPPCFA
ncbi:MAG: hypothetical protein JNK90_19750 [Planctomycetaceae bacterium]|nr:hypothetical protein [Planctomycetaceae bacterium]MBN8602816.1 hypothetical protein [Planctomycetota bacterium]